MPRKMLVFLWSPALRIPLAAREFGDKERLQFHQIFEMFLGDQPFGRFALAETRDRVVESVADISPPDLDRELIDIDRRRGRETQHVLDDR